MAASNDETRRSCGGRVEQDAVGQLLRGPVHSPIIVAQSVRRAYDQTHASKHGAASTLRGRRSSQILAARLPGWVGVIA